MSGTNLVPLFSKEGSGEIFILVRLLQSPLAPLFQRGIIKMLSTRPPVVTTLNVIEPVRRITKT